MGNDWAMIRTKIFRILLALRARKVAARARIFQAITQVKTRVQQNTLRDYLLEGSIFLD